MKNGFKIKSGVTLVELILAAAITMIILGLAFSFTIFSTRSFNAGDKQTDLQSKTRLAASQITKQIRQSITVEILSDVPGVFEQDKKYLYSDGNKVIMNWGTVQEDITEIIDEGITLGFIKGNGDDILEFLLRSDPSGNDYNISSEVLIQNMGENVIGGETSGNAVSFGPFTKSEVVAADTTALDILDINNLFGNNIMYSLLLPGMGANNSTIVWSSSNTSVIENDGNVIRPSINTGNANVTLTATITMDDETLTKDFAFIVLDRDNLSLNVSSPPNALLGVQYIHQFTASGGYEGYDFTIESGSLPTGLTLVPGSGVLTGTPTAVGTYTFTVMVEDLDDIENDPNDTASREFSITVTN